MADLDMKKFKKVHAEDGHAILQHEDGHELKVAYKALSPKLRKSLDALPMAHGGDMDEGMSKQGRYVRQANREKDVAPDHSNVQMDRAKKEAKQSLEKQKDMPKNYPQHFVDGGQVMPDAAQPMAAPEMPPSAMDAQQVQPQTPSAGAGVAQNPGQDINQYVQSTNADLNNEIMNHKQDLDYGHITPKTYQDLFAEKSTLGKIGTLFGLLISGAGSGLSHQPNAVMAMMDKQIQNDLDAQKTSTGNRQNFLKIAQQQQLNEATIKNLERQGILTQEQAQGMRFDNMFKANGLGLSYGRNTAIHHIGTMVDSIPPNSPLKAPALQAFQSVNQAAAASNAALAQSVSQTSGQLKQRYGIPGQDEISQMLASSPSGGFVKDVINKAKETKAEAASPEETKKKEAKKAEGAFQAAADQIPGDKILGPNADQVLQREKANPYSPDFETLKKGYNDARQIETLLPRVHKIMDEMFTNVQKGGYSTYARRQLTPESAAEMGGSAGSVAGGIGETLGRLAGAGMNLVPQSPEYRDYNTAKSQLMTEIRTIFPNIGHDELMSMVGPNSPEYGDTQASLAKKENAIKRALIQRVPIGMLQNKGMLVR